MNNSIISNIFDSFLSIAKIILLSNLNPTLRKFTTSKTLVVLGNGPSLIDSIKSMNVDKDREDYLCVNYFPISENYQIIKPQYIVLAAPEYWMENISDEYKTIQRDLFTALIEKTNWKIKLFVPFFSRKNNNFVKMMDRNKYIELVYFNTTPIEGNRKISEFLIKKNFGIPRPHNVLVPSLIIGINLGYKVIKLYGVDHSWLKEISVTEKNEALVAQKHFYDEDAKPKVMNLLGQRPRKLHEILQKFYYAFRSYHEIEAYAKSKKVIIYNYTKDSFIDAFERK